MKQRLFLYGKQSLVLVLALSLLGCLGVSNKRVTKSSVMEYLYPDDASYATKPSIPHLTLPLRVGIAFAPESRLEKSDSFFWHSDSALVEEKKMALLNRVADEFKGLDFVGGIEVIPTSYLRPRGGFDNLLQLKTLYGIDVIALVSYDQVQFTDGGLLSLSYWTIVGAYAIAGEKNDTSTLMDTVVFDIDSRKLLFRAPGTSQVSGRATPINLGEELRADSLTGFEQATEQMIANLKTALTSFKQSLKDKPEQATISYQEGYEGAGALAWLELWVLLSALVMRFGVGYGRRFVAMAVSYRG